MCRDKNKYYCRINGGIENLSDIQELIEAKATLEKIFDALINNHGMEIIDAIMFKDVLKFNNWEIPVDYNEVLEQLKERNGMLYANNISQCPDVGLLMLEERQSEWLVV